MGSLPNFTDLAGFSVFIWAVFAIEFLLKMTISNMLKSEDNISTKHQILESRDYKNIENIASYLILFHNQEDINFQLF